MLDKTTLPQHPFYLENNYKHVTENVGCEVSRPMTDPQPTSKGNYTETEKPLENRSPPWKIISEVINNCSEETRKEIAQELDKKLQEIEGGKP